MYNLQDTSDHMLLVLANSNAAPAKLYFCDKFPIIYDSG